MTAGKRYTSNAMQSGIRRFPRLVRFEQSRAVGNSVVRRGMGDRNVLADLAVTAQAKSTHPSLRRIIETWRPERIGAPGDGQPDCLKCGPQGLVSRQRSILFGPGRFGCRRKLPRRRFFGPRRLAGNSYRFAAAAGRAGLYCYREPITGCCCQHLHCRQHLPGPTTLGPVQVRLRT